MGNPVIVRAVERTISTRCTRTKKRLLILGARNMAQQTQPNHPQQGNKPGQPNQMPNKPGQTSQQSGSGQNDQSANKK
jgi:hypothetical protein